MMGSAAPGPARVDFEIWSTTATLVVTKASARGLARATHDEELAAIELACSRFRPDSEINSLLRRPGVEVELSPVLNDAPASVVPLGGRAAPVVESK